MRRRSVLLLMLAGLLSACSLRGPVQSPAPAEPADPGGGVSRPVAIYLSAASPAIQAPPGVERVAGMPELKALAGDSARAIWLDAAAAGQVDREWLRERYNRHWPVFLFGTGAHAVLLDLLGIQGEAAQAGQGAYRQRAPGPLFTQGVWPEIPPGSEAARVAADLLAEGEVTLEPVKPAEAPVPVREFAAKMGRFEIAQTLRMGSETYLLISGGWQVASARRTLGAVEVRAAKDPSAPALGIWRMRIGGSPVTVQSADPYLPQVINVHRLPEVPITGPAVLVTPTPGARGGGKFRVTGYVRAFEATYHVRLKDQTGKVVATAWGTAASGGPDWGSFVTELPYTGTGAATLEIYVESAADGKEIVLTSVSVEL